MNPPHLLKALHSLQLNCLHIIFSLSLIFTLKHLCFLLPCHSFYIQIIATLEDKCIKNKIIIAVCSFVLYKQTCFIGLTSVLLAVSVLFALGKKNYKKEIKDRQVIKKARL